MLLLALALAAFPDVAAVGVIVSPRPEGCVAVLRSAGRTRVASVGETAFGGRVLSIAAGRVVLGFDSGRLELRLGAEASAGPTSPPAVSDGPPAPPETPPVYERSLARAEVEKRLATELPRILAESALAPVIEDGRVIGMRVVRVAPGTLLTDLGLRPGDVLQSLNDTPTDSLPAMLALWPRLQSETQLRAMILREGRPLTLSVALR
jgi:type II secretory pathway component PulC